MTTEHDTLLTLCHDLQHAGIWLYLNEQGGLIAGPTTAVAAHPALLDGLREQKEAIIRLLEDSLAHTLFGEKDDPRFERERCPACEQEVYVVLRPRRLAVHRQGKSVCAGSDQAQRVATEQIMTAFTVDRCVLRGGMITTWQGLRGALEAWCREREFLLPPRPFVMAWLDSHFQRLAGFEEVPRWAGLAVTVAEWLGEDEPTDGQQEALPLVRKKTLMAT